MRFNNVLEGDLTSDFSMIVSRTVLRLYREYHRLKSFEAVKRTEKVRIALHQNRNNSRNPHFSNNAEEVLFLETIGITCQTANQGTHAVSSSLPECGLAKCSSQFNGLT